MFENKFNRIESQICVVIWTSSVIYSIWQFTNVSQTYFLGFQDIYNDFTSGWSALDYRKKDSADFEWETFKYFLSSIFPILVSFQLLSTAFTWIFSFKATKRLELMLISLYLIYNRGWIVASLIFFQPICFYLTGLLKSKFEIWICNFTCLALITIYKKVSASETVLDYLGSNHFDAHLTLLLLSWMHLKCSSFFLNKPLNARLEDYLSYCFYPPTLFTGPFIPFEDYSRKTKIDFKKTLKLKQFAVNIVRCVFWYFFLEFVLHFIYFNAASFQLKLVRNLDICSLCGYGYLLGQFFHIKYIVLYGLSTSFASLDGIRVPTLPRCIGRVHLYSDMWKYFDPGLHNYLKNCIFIPSITEFGLPKFVASLLCFVFVFIWHGTERYILIWATLNFIGITLEKLAGNLYQFYLKPLDLVKGDNLRRLKNVFSAPLLAMSAVSNFYFFAGEEVGNVFVDKIRAEADFNKLLVLCLLYCCCEVSTELRNVDAHRM